MRKSILGLMSIILILVQLACNLPSNAPSVATITLTPTTSPPLIQGTSPTLAIATNTLTPAAPQDPLVLRATLCWQGPGPKYIVVSSLNQGERVKLLGKGSIPGWYIVENPIYHDLCWMAATDLQVDPGIDLASLKVYTPPIPKPTKKPKQTPTP